MQYEKGLQIEAGGQKERCSVLNVSFSSTKHSFTRRNADLGYSEVTDFFKPKPSEGLYRSSTVGFRLGAFDMQSDLGRAQFGKHDQLCSGKIQRHDKVLVLIGNVTVQSQCVCTRHQCNSNGIKQ